MPARLAGKVALVTGASRGIGKGVALGLGEEGCTVYVTGKTLRDAESNRPGSVTATARSRYLRLTKTEGVLAHPDLFPDLSKAWSPTFNGRAVVALASGPKIMERTGRAFKADVLAEEYDFQDIDGRGPIKEAVKPPT
jgi:NAD(P)-dependent dehydrogenase (short-subunit alcohol dehydrogenase family)